MQLLVAKNVAIFFAAATIAFGVATIVLAVQKADLEDELQDARDKLDAYSTETPSFTTPSTTSSTTGPGTGTTTTVAGDTTITTTSSSTASPSTGTPTITTPSGGSSTPSGGSSTPSGGSSTPSSTPSSTTIDPWPTVTLPPEGPQFPTLPPGLTDPESIVYRLPTDLYAVKYRLYWYPDLVKKECSGSVSIQIEIVKETNLVIMHASQLTVGSVSILNMMAYNRIRVKSMTYRDELLIIELYELLRTATPYVVSMDFECNLEGLNGVYASSYQNEKGEDRWIATSKFEPTYARRAFPCFDEPDMKAQFTITVVRPTGDGYHALSNMNVETENVLGDITEVVFEESVPMSTYLACFIVSDFAFQEKTVKSDSPGSQDFQMRVFSTAAQVNKVKYALDTGVGITEFYIKYFGIAYPLPKLDMAAIPDFVSGAMEHWGLVTYRETALLYDENISSAANKQRVATVVAHELAHMWFGNLVTMKWWNDLWLNEGFASYIEYKGVHEMHPEWQMLDQFLISDLHDVMDFDATLASHPIVQTAETPSQITELFDSITYSKGASIIRMLEDLVGEEKFRNGTTDYLNKFYFSNAETDDYLTEIEAQGFDFDVKLIMQTWTQQMGLPVVEVTRTGNSYKLTQKRFFTNAEDYNGQYDDSQFNYRWSIPITYFTNANPEVQRTIFNYNDQETTVNVPSAVNWIKFNKNQVGYYRVNYPTDMWQNLIDALNTNRGVFSVSDRAHLVSDVFALADGAQLSYSIALDLSTYLEKELDYVPWKVGSTRLNSIKSLLYYTDLYSDFSAYGRKLLTAVVESIGFEVGTDHLQNLMRSNLLSTACGFGHEFALEEAVKRFNTWLADPSQPPKPDVRSTIYYYGMQRAGNEKIWNQVWSLYMAEQDAQEKIKLMEALAAIKEPWILQRFINLAWEEKNVRGQDYFSCLQYIANNRVGESLVWDYVRENWPRLVARFGISERNLGRLIPRITQRFASKTKLEEMEVFFKKYPEAGAGTAARKEALENVKNNIKWLEQNKAQIGQWLAQQRSAAVAKTNSV